MEIIALQEYTDNKISLYEGEIRNVGNNLASKLIEQGIAAEHNEGSGGGSDVLVVNMLIKRDLTETYYEKYNCETETTSEEVIFALKNGKYVVIKGSIDQSDGAPSDYLFTYYFFLDVGQLSHPDNPNISFNYLMFTGGNDKKIEKYRIDCSLRGSWSFFKQQVY